MKNKLKIKKKIISFYATINFTVFEGRKRRKRKVLRFLCCWWVGSELTRACDNSERRSDGGRVAAKESIVKFNYSKFYKQLLVYDFYHK